LTLVTIAGAGDGVAPSAVEAASSDKQRTTSDARFMIFRWAISAEWNQPDKRHHS